MVWEQVNQDIDGKVVSGGGGFGEEIDLSKDGSTIIVGAPNGFPVNGYAQVFRNQNNLWQQIGDDIN